MLRVTLVLLVLLVAAPSAAAQSGLPRDLWDPPPPNGDGTAESPASDGPPSTALVIGLALAGAALTGFLLRVTPPLVYEAARARRRRRRRPEPAAAPEPADEPQPLEECSIGLAHGWGRGRFEVRVPDAGDEGHVVALSTPFAVSRYGKIRDAGQARAAHRRRVWLLRAAGWRPHGGGPAWYDAHFVRPRPDPGAPAVDRAVVAPAPDDDDVRFIAVAVDDYGNPAPLAQSPPFAPPSNGQIERTDAAVAAHGTLLADLEPHGWSACDSLDAWYATILRRPRD
jgi:hypothetical protein